MVFSPHRPDRRLLFKLGSDPLQMSTLSREFHAPRFVPFLLEKLLLLSACCFIAIFQLHAAIFSWFMHPLDWD